MKTNKAMISQPMCGISDEEIISVRDNAISILKEKGYDIINTLFEDESYRDENLKDLGVVQIPVYFLAKSLECMSQCNVVYFCKGWERARGCRIEHDVAKAYGLIILYEE